MCGEGGVITTSNAEVADRARVLRNQGMRERYRYEGLGYNYRMTEIQAALALCQIDRLDTITAARRFNAARLSGALRTVRIPDVADDRCHAWHQYTVRIDAGRDRDAAAARLAQAGVGTGVYYPRPISRLEHVVEVCGHLDMPAAELAAAEVLSLPVHPGLSEADLELIAREVNRL